MLLSAEATHAETPDQTQYYTYRERHKIFNNTCTHIKAFRYPNRLLSARNHIDGPRNHQVVPSDPETTGQGTLFRTKATCYIFSNTIIANNLSCAFSAVMVHNFEFMRIMFVKKYKL